MIKTQISGIKSSINCTELSCHPKAELVEEGENGSGEVEEGNRAHGRDVGG